MCKCRRITGYCAGLNVHDMSDTKKLPFAEDYWKQDGGQKWVELIDATESYLDVFNKMLFERADIATGESVLDIGCGGGLTSIELANRVGTEGRVMGVDISPDILAVAGVRGRAVANLKFTEGDVATMHLEPGAFSLIFSRFGMMFFSDPVMAFSKLRNALKPSGRMVFLCWRTFDENPWMKEPTQAVFEILPPQDPPPQPDSPGPFSLGKKERIEYLLGAAGFKSIAIEALDTGMSMGALTDVVDYFMRMGPAAAVIADAADEHQTAARTVIREVLKRYETDQGVITKAAAWIVTAV